ncbi:hypothetical protein NPIL_294481 [Nephila pilipes]|uniref:Uncharacterized protein n=1 Tax=Nephila pilipes TaxID=299642 RepID=A0A8X6I2G7_NEPPI|nr:hypothetical protein NPIL_294481 [Nephila pilipes]
MGVLGNEIVDAMERTESVARSRHTTGPTTYKHTSTTVWLLLKSSRYVELLISLAVTGRTVLNSTIYLQPFLSFTGRLSIEWLISHGWP